MRSAQWIREVVLSAYPKIYVSPEREIIGLGSIIERRKEMTREIYNAIKPRETKSKKKVDR